MANIVYATPYQPPTPAAPAFSGLGMRWTAKGSEWSLTDPSTGLFLKPGVRGLGSAAYTRHSTSSPAVAGSKFEGASFLDREVFWPLHIFSDAGSVEWMERDRAFWATMDPEDTGVWTVTHPDGAHRTLRLRFLNDGDKVRDRDPMRTGWDSYGITLLAEQPFWVGDPVVKSFIGQVPPEPFFGTDGPVVKIASSYSAANATMDNPGDVESYPRWYVDGETTSVSVGVNGVVVTVPFAVPAGKCLVIESDPDLIGATLYDVTVGGASKKPSDRVFGADLINPADVSPALGEADFAPIPSGSQVPLSMEITGPGRVECLLPTLYRRPW